MPRSFTDEIRDLRRGALVEALTEKMAELVTAVATTGKPGKLTLELSLKRVGRGAVTVSDKIAVKSPEAVADNETLMFPTPEGSLLTQDPRQSALDLKEAPAPEKPAELKVATQGGE